MEELETLLQESMVNLESEFYNKPFYFSYSSLNKLLWNPPTFYQIYVLGNREELMDKHLIEGRVIHALLLEKDRFEEQFLISPTNLPTGLGRQTVDKVFYRYIANKEVYQNQLGDQPKLEHFADEIKDAMKDLNYYQQLKTDQQRLDKILTAEMSSYWDFLQKKSGRTIIDEDTYQYCSRAVDMVRLNERVNQLMGLDVSEFDDNEVINETFVQMQLSFKPFGLKGIIDNIHLDHAQKVIWINDLKTSGKSLKDFPESVEYFGYWMQAAIYAALIQEKYGVYLNNGYKMRFHFVVIDCNLQVYPFDVSQETMHKWILRLKDVIEKAEWHYTNRSFDLPYEYATGMIKL